jgi:hypothetical protein
MVRAADREPVGQSGEAQRRIELAQVGHRLLRLVLAAGQRLARREDAGLPALLCACENEGGCFRFGSMTPVPTENVWPAPSASGFNDPVFPVCINVSGPWD